MTASHQEGRDRERGGGAARCSTLGLIAPLHTSLIYNYGERRKKGVEKSRERDGHDDRAENELDLLSSFTVVRKKGGGEKGEKEKKKRSAKTVVAGLNRQSGIRLSLPIMLRRGGGGKKEGKKGGNARNMMLSSLSLFLQEKRKKRKKGGKRKRRKGSKDVGEVALTKGKGGEKGKSLPPYMCLLFLLIPITRRGKERKKGGRAENIPITLSYIFQKEERGGVLAGTRSVIDCIVLVCMSSLSRGEEERGEISLP